MIVIISTLVELQLMAFLLQMKDYVLDLNNKINYLNLNIFKKIIKKNL